MPIRLLFLNTRDQCGADVGVHFALMKSLDPGRVAVHVISNSEAADAADMRRQIERIPHLTSAFLPLGKPSHVLAGRGRVRRLAAYGPSAWSMARAVMLSRRWRIQVMHATDRPRDASYVTALGRVCGAVSVVQMHAHVSDLSAPTVWGMRNASAIFSVSDAVRDELIHYGLPAGKIHTLHNSVDSHHFDPDRVDPGSSAELRARFGIPAGAPLVGIAARMNPWKGQLELISAVAQLKERRPDLHVIIVGADVPDMRAMYEQRAREGGVLDRIHFAGHQKDVRPFLAAFDLFAHPSYNEPFGLAIAEAMAMRKPVIACNAGGVPEIITHAQDGWLVAERSSEAVASALALLLDDADLRRRLGQAARETIINRFSPAVQSRNAAALYEGLVATARRSAHPQASVPGIKSP